MAAAKTATGDRIIPARAGFTWDSRLPEETAADHPRSRGVYLRPGRAYWWRVGSSPLARGLLVVEWGSKEIVGIIPARAGFTSGHEGACRLPQDHPRSRGVYSGFYENEEVLAGSSPLARGLRE